MYIWDHTCMFEIHKWKYGVTFRQIPHTFRCFPHKLHHDCYDFIRTSYSNQSLITYIPRLYLGYISAKIVDSNSGTH